MSRSSFSSSTPYNAADVPVTAACSGYQDVDGLLVAPFLQRGCNWARDGTKVASQNHALVGMTAKGLPAIAEYHLWETLRDDHPWMPYLNKGLVVKPLNSGELTKHYVPFSTLFCRQQVRDLKMSLPIQSAQVGRHIAADAELLETLWDNGLELGPNSHCILDTATAFRGHDFTAPRNTRFVPWQTQPSPNKKQRPDSVEYPFFTLPAFTLTVLLYFWIMGDPFMRPESSRPRRNKHKVPFVRLEVFILYFPTWLRFHELYRLGAYVHPNDFITAQYQNDVRASLDYAILAQDWVSKFSSLKSHQVPFAFLSPAMMEGSALGGPFLPTEWPLGAIHHYMGLGSIWTIGLPFVPSSTVVEGNSFCYRLFAFPRHWQSELRIRGYPAEQLNLSFNSNHTTSVPAERLAFLQPDLLSRILGSYNYQISLIGAKLGASSLLENPGWTSHFPGEHGLICVKHGMHQISDFQFAINPIAAAMEHQQRCSPSSCYSASGDQLPHN